MDIGRGYLLSNFGVLFLFLLIFLFLVYNKLGKKLMEGPDCFSSIRINFQKKHPKANKIITKGTTIFVLVLFLFLMPSYVIDIIFFDVKTTEGKVNDISYSRFFNKTIYLENGECFSALFMPEMSEGKTYRVYYVPNTNNIVKVVELEK